MEETIGAEAMQALNVLDQHQRVELKVRGIHSHPAAAQMGTFACFCSLVSSRWSCTNASVWKTSGSLASAHLLVHVGRALTPRFGKPQVH
ncbi:hypothetical protein PGTUg99_027933 [Puccinia graminis f. sp. tritici]|uniref:Uncharacterized protein n=1 Tax=Puccinia graminis f. sp. tritici TaxID=56615 RepID=A0A5B0RWW9_PUCGR|nr:hypothetical protein PGTUg99_027933 [Puccinia graminis f. sp. tritici]